MLRKYLSVLATASVVFASRPPPMGFNTFDVLSTTTTGYGLQWLNDTSIRKVSDVFFYNLQQFGYNYINIDSGWSSGEDENGIPFPDPKRWPSGIVGLANFLHSRSQKIGLYTTIGLIKGVYQKNAPILGTNCTSHQIASQPLTDVPNGWGNAYMVNTSVCTALFRFISRSICKLGN